MRLGRRSFLILSGLLGVGLLGALKQWIKPRSLAEPQTVATATTAATPSNEAIANSAANLQKANSGLLLRFVITADSGAGDDNQYGVARAMANYHRQNPYNLALLGGDNIYNEGEIWKISQVFEQPYAPLLKQGVRFQACLGNHDIRTDNGVPQVKYAGFNMADRYYTFTEQGVQFFALDTNVNANWDAQLAWLERELSRSQAAWKIVYGHHPIYASGVYGTNSTFVKLFTPLFKKYGVQLYMNGHEHHYERTRSIEGTTYIITGHGGAHLRAVGKSDWTEYAVSRFGFTALEVYGDRIEVKAIASDDSIFDQGTIPLRSA
jgi:Calcineurin-like phosphoesterase